MVAKTFKDLIVWQESYKLTLDIYKITENFPQHEKNGLTSQLRRSAVSVSSNIAEGFGRNGAREKDQFYAMAHGSLTELENEILVAKGVGYIDQEVFIQLESAYVLTQKLLSGLQKANKLKGERSKLLKSRI